MKKNVWKIKLYETESGNIPLISFIESLDKTAQAKIYHSLTLLEEYGVSLGTAHTKKLKNADVWELRVLGNNSLRILYVAIENKTFLLLHGFVKKKMSIDKNDIKTAQKRLQRYYTQRKN